MPPSQRTELPIPPEVDALVLACLEKDPPDRPQNAEELLRLLDGCRAGRPLEQRAGARAGGSGICRSSPARSRPKNPSKSPRPRRRLRAFTPD